MMTTKCALALSLAAACAAAGLSPAAHAGSKPYALVHSFQARGNTGDGASPSGLMAYAGARLYGTTQGGGPANGGTVFRLNPATGRESVLYAFQGGADGFAPSRDVVTHDGTLYGTTAFGGQPQGDTHGYLEDGTIFSIDLKTGVKTTLFEFPNDGSLGYTPGDLIDVDGVLYGTTAGRGYSGDATYEGTLFSFDTKTGVFTNLRTFDSQDRLDAAFPLSGLINLKGTLYGASSGGGNGAGAIFSYTIKTGVFDVLLGTLGETHGDPTQLYATPAYLDGALYLTSKSGGISQNYYGYGTVFKFDLTTHAMTVLYSFQNGSDGQQPLGGLIYLNGLLYGTTVVSGTKGGGALFSIDPASGAETTLHSFSSTKGASEPVTSMTDVNGTLFGTTFDGGTQNLGAIYQYTP